MGSLNKQFFQTINLMPWSHPFRLGLHFFSFMGLDLGHQRHNVSPWYASNNIYASLGTPKNQGIVEIGDSIDAW